jgi:hypothetical protein
MGIWQGLANGHGLPKVSLGPAIPDPTIPYGRVSEWPARKAGGRQAIFYRILSFWTPYAVCQKASPSVVFSASTLAALFCLKASDAAMWRLPSTCERPLRPCGAQWGTVGRNPVIWGENGIDEIQFRDFLV